MILPQSSEPVTPLMQRPGLRQFIKFGIVGASSTVVNFAILNLMMIVFHQGRYVAETIAFLVSVVNGYAWNNRWTFKEAQAKAVHTQFGQFLLVSAVGLVLNLLIIRLISVPLEHDFSCSVIKATNISQLIATGVVVFWNYFANRHWTFKH